MKKFETEQPKVAVENFGDTLDIESTEGNINVMQDVSKIDLKNKIISELNLKLEGILDVSKSIEGNN